MKTFELNKNYFDNTKSVLASLPDNVIDCCITSPAYFGLHDYGVNGQIGRENILKQYITNLASVFAKVYRIMKYINT